MGHGSVHYINSTVGLCTCARLSLHAHLQVLETVKAHTPPFHTMDPSQGDSSQSNKIKNVFLLFSLAPSASFASLRNPVVFSTVDLCTNINKTQPTGEWEPFPGLSVKDHQVLSPFRSPALVLYSSFPRLNSCSARPAVPIATFIH